MFQFKSRHNVRFQAKIEDAKEEVKGKATIPTEERTTVAAIETTAVKNVQVTKADAARIVAQTKNKHL